MLKGARIYRTLSYLRSMRRISLTLKCAVTAFLTSLALAVPVAAADDVELEALFEGLKTADDAAALQIENRIQEIWSQSCAHAAALDQLPEWASSPQTDGPLGGQHTRPWPKASPRTLFGAGAAACFRTRSMVPSKIFTRWCSWEGAEGCKASMDIWRQRFSAVTQWAYCGHATRKGTSRSWSLHMGQHQLLLLHTTSRTL